MGNRKRPVPHSGNVVHRRSRCFSWGYSVNRNDYALIILVFIFVYILWWVIL